MRVIHICNKISSLSLTQNTKTSSKYHKSWLFLFEHLLLTFSLKNYFLTRGQWNPRWRGDRPSSRNPTSVRLWHRRWSRCSCRRCCRGRGSHCFCRNSRPLLLRKPAWEASTELWSVRWRWRSRSRRPCCWRTRSSGWSCTIWGFPFWCARCSFGRTVLLRWVEPLSSSCCTKLKIKLG